MTKKQTPFDMALNYLSIRDRTEKELSDYLFKKNLSENEVGETLNKLKYYGYIDDERYIRNACENNKSFNHFGKRRLISDLRKKGITDRELMLVEDYFSSEDEAQCCFEQFKTAQKKYASEPSDKKRRKISAYLQRRGFSYDAFSHWLSELQSDDEAEEPVDWKQLQSSYEHYYKMQSRKGYNGWELYQRIKRNLLSKGYDFESVNIIIEKNKND